MSVSSVSRPIQQENRSPSRFENASPLTPSSPREESSISATSSYSCITQALFAFLNLVKEKVCCCFASSPSCVTQQDVIEEASTIQAIETDEAPPPSPLSGRRTYEDVEQLVAEFQHHVPPFPSDLDPNAVSRSLYHAGRTYREVFDAEQPFYLSAVRQMHQVLASCLEIQVESHFQLNQDTLLREVHSPHTNLGPMHELFTSLPGIGTPREENLQYFPLLQFYQRLLREIASLQQL